MADLEGAVQLEVKTNGAIEIDQDDTVLGNIQVHAAEDPPGQGGATMRQQLPIHVTLL
jgi:hypothetical protein